MFYNKYTTVLKNLSLVYTIGIGAIAYKFYIDNQAQIKIEMEIVENAYKVLSNFKEEYTQNFINREDLLKMIKYNSELTKNSFKTNYEVITSKIDESLNSLLGIKDYLNSLNDKPVIENSDMSNITNKLEDKIEVIKKGIEDIDSLLKYNDSLTELILSKYNLFLNYLTTLSLEQSFALVHVLFLIAILIALFNLASVFYGESLIQVFKIEIRFPKLAKIINIRRKFQQYYFGWNLFIIFSIIISLLYFNFIVLIF